MPPRDNDKKQNEKKPQVQGEDKIWYEVRGRIVEEDGTVTEYNEMTAPMKRAGLSNIELFRQRPDAQAIWVLKGGSRDPYRAPWQWYALDLVDVAAVVTGSPKRTANRAKKKSNRATKEPNRANKEPQPPVVPEEQSAPIVRGEGTDAVVSSTKTKPNGHANGHTNGVIKSALGN